MHQPSREQSCMREFSWSKNGSKLLLPSLASSPGAMTGGFRRMRTASSASLQSAQWIPACKCGSGCPCPSQLCSTSGLSGLSDAWHRELLRNSRNETNSTILARPRSNLPARGFPWPLLECKDLCKSDFAARHDAAVCAVVGPGPALHQWCSRHLYAVSPAKVDIINGHPSL